MPFNPFSALTSKIFAGIAIFAISFAVIQTIRLDGFFWIDGVIEKLEKERAAHITTKVNVANAQRVAADLNRKQIETIQNRYKAIAEKSEILYEKRLTDSRAVVDKFMRSQAVKRPTEGTGASGPAQVQPEVAGTGEMPIVPEGFILLPVNEAYMIAGAYDKLAALQDAAKETMAVDTNE